MSTTVKFRKSAEEEPEPKLGKDLSPGIYRMVDEYDDDPVILFVAAKGKAIGVTDGAIEVAQSSGWLSESFVPID